MADPVTRLKSALADRYSIERELGAGGMATVYLAEDLRHHRKVALKVLRPELAASLGAERFHREIQIAARLQHPHILPLLDSGEAAGSLFYVMPYVEGQSLRERLAREGALPITDAIRILRDVVDALTEAHAHGVVHRDIKPENIMLRSRHALVTDFGVAKAVSEATGRQTLTTAGVALGTPAYMAPEQASADPKLDHRVDIYAVGAVAYELLTGRPVFMGTTPQMVLSAHVTEAPQPISKLREAVPRALEALVMRCLVKQPADRWQSAEELLPQLEALATPSGGITPTETQPVPGVRRLGVRQRVVVAATAVLVVAASLGLWWRFSHVRGHAHHPRTAIAVLPFENLSAQGSNGFFASGLHDELLAQLAKVGSLTVIGPTSVRAYEGSSKRLSDIADELSVGSIVEGSLQIAGNRLRVIVQLIDPATEAHLWAEHYDTTLDDAFAVQSDIARRIVAGVGAQITTSEAGAVAAAPTGNAAAYRAYLAGMAYFRRPGYLRPSLEAALALLDSAVLLDPGFALAHARLSVAHGSLFWFRYDPSETRAALQAREAESALRLAPWLPEAHLATGLVHYWHHRDYRAALSEITVALRGAPNDPQLWEYAGYLHRRLGNWDSVEIAFQHAIQLDPRDVDALTDLGAGTFVTLGRFAEAIQMYRRASELAPDVPELRVVIGLAVFDQTGTLDTLRRVLVGLPPDADLGTTGPASYPSAKLLLWERRPDSLLALLRRLRLRVFESNMEYEPVPLYAAWAHLLRGDHLAARASFDSAVVLLDSAAQVMPDDWRVHVARGQALAGLGRHERAMEEARYLQASEVYRADHVFGTTAMLGRALILAQLGDVDSAFAELARLSARPALERNPNLLRIDPRWDAIRSDPRFEALLTNPASQPH